MRITPPWMSVPPVNELLPLTMSVPPPSLTRPPVPLMSPCWFSVAPVAVVMLAPREPITMSRAVVIVCVTDRLPPLMAMLPAASPRLASDATCNVPPLIAVPPV